MGTEKGIGKGRTITCKFCGETGLRWDRAFIESTRDARNPSGIVRMWKPRTGEIHLCSEWSKRMSRVANGLIPISPAEIEDPQEITAPDPVEIMEKAIQTAGISKSEVMRIVDGKATELRNEFLSSDNKIVAKMEANNTVLLGSIADLERRIDLARPLAIPQPDGTKREITRQHKDFPDLLALANLRLNVFLVGPAGGGKTSAAEKAAEALGLEFFLQPMGPGVTESRLLGWMDANGQVVRPLFREAYENGGVFMADEMDNSNASALTTLNGALANGVVGFPDGMVRRHKDFIFIGGANTYGRGADRMYVGRQQLDGATLDRMATLNWDYDPDFELFLAGNDQKDWVKYVQRIRAIAFDNKLRVIVSPRASIDGARMLRAGVRRDLVEAVKLWNGMPEAEKTTIKNNLEKPKPSYESREPTYANKYDRYR